MQALGTRKTIHEKHVFQLFGTVVAMRIEHPDKTISGTFTTTTTLSDRARQFADHLDIRVEEAVPLAADYPRSSATSAAKVSASTTCRSIKNTTRSSSNLRRASAGLPLSPKPSSTAFVARGNGRARPRRKRCVGRQSAASRRLRRAVVVEAPAGGAHGGDALRGGDPGQVGIGGRGAAVAELAGDDVKGDVGRDQFRGVRVAQPVAGTRLSMPARSPSFGRSRRTYDESMGWPGVRPPSPDATEQKSGCRQPSPSPRRTSSHARRYPSAFPSMAATRALRPLPLRTLTVPALLVDIARLQRQRFADTQARAPQQRDQRAVTHGQRATAADRVHERLRFIGGQRLGGVALRQALAGVGILASIGALDTLPTKSVPGSSPSVKRLSRSAESVATHTRTGTSPSASPSTPPTPAALAPRRIPSRPRRAWIPSAGASRGSLGGIAIATAADAISAVVGSHPATLYGCRNAGPQRSERAPNRN